ncbi:hypothetical protein ABZU25_15350 [Micromonospora sp. NPDC005215]|uniref:dioxygenase family protein n=1 Tax=Micromonospora sp. NPDC005215 TaxID=3157024 RepID=UPI0033B0D0D5
MPLTIELTIRDLANGQKAFAGTAVYVWHCDRDGSYSMYSDGVTDQNYLRGVQIADAAGSVRFTSISPPATPGGGPTSTSRSTPTRRASPTRARPSRPHRSRCPKHPCHGVRTAGLRDLGRQPRSGQP